MRGFCHQYLEWIDVTVQNPLQQVNALTFTEAYGVDNEGNKDAFCFAQNRELMNLAMCKNTMITRTYENDTTMCINKNWCT